MPHLSNTSKGSPSAAAKRRPNVVVFFTDQQRWDTTGLHGNPLDLTPNLDRVAQQNLHVAHSFTCQPVCGPARSCLQTGLYATTTGCWRNSIPLPPDSRTLAHYFGEAGYDTGYIGKWHLYDREVEGPVPADRRFGYDYWLASNVLEFTSDAYDTVLYDNDDNEQRLPGYRVDAVTDAAIRYVDTHQDDPFFLFVSYIEPHHQNHIDDYPPPTGYRERYTGRWVPPDLAALGGSTHQHLGGYYGMVKRLDEAYGRMQDALRSMGLQDDTIVLFTSDHGNHFKTRNGEYKRSCHESSIRVPTVLSGPGFQGAGQLPELVSLIDLPPTVLAAGDIEAPAQMRGHPLQKLLQEGPGDWPSDVFVQISESMVGRALRTDRWKYSIHAPDRDPVHDASSDRYEEYCLYDLQNDPHERNNLVDFKNHEDLRKELAERLKQRMKEAGESPCTIG